ncbi:hypothetical protein [Actinomycetospora cinnamomea]|uniref:DUF4190 domain-containing protein n=1 Tax=Actinomycetospora cinnamomea TaxID=663609 RepID=A0A2U1EBI6_9PSEU|nr:hypothetical protein [Actinomycetospora cinnamomea]PVY97313.1 hypothetical protein C8D89_12555 [Actinomycetospora cinnamomea]
MTTPHGAPRRRVDLRPTDGSGPADPEARTETLRAVEPEPVPAPPRRAPRARRDEQPVEEPVEEPTQRNGMGTPALVLGLLAVATSWTGWAGVVLGLPAVVAGFLGARRAFRNLATDGAASLGGFVTGLAGLVVGAVMVWPTLFGTGGFGDGLTLDQCMAQSTTAREMHMCKSQHLAEFNQRYPNAAE